MLTFPLFFSKNCICEKLLYFEGTDIAFGNPTSKLRSRNAAHTTVHSFFFKNPFAPVIPLCCLLASELSVSNKVE